MGCDNMQFDLINLIELDFQTSNYRHSAFAGDTISLSQVLNIALNQVRKVYILFLSTHYIVINHPNKRLMLHACTK